MQEELYFIDYKDYCSLHPEIRNLPEDIKKYRYDLLEDFRKKTIEQIKEQRNLKMNKSGPDSATKENRAKTTKQEEEKNKGNTSEQQENKYVSKTFSEKMEDMNLEKKNIEKIKKKQKQNIEYLIEQQMKAELLNKKNIEKDKKLREKEEQNKKEMEEKRIINKKIQEEKKQKRKDNVEKMMEIRVDKISKQHQKIEKRRNEIIQEHNKKRE